MAYPPYPPPKRYLVTIRHYLTYAVEVDDINVTNREEALEYAMGTIYSIDGHGSPEDYLVDERETITFKCEPYEVPPKIQRMSEASRWL
jgi:hypothetical protein